MHSAGKRLCMISSLADRVVDDIQRVILLRTR